MSEPRLVKRWILVGSDGTEEAFYTEAGAYYWLRYFDERRPGVTFVVQRRGES
jgi:hypothetical protein